MRNGDKMNNLINSMYQDNDYKSYLEKYEEKNVVDYILLEILLKKYVDILEVFYKINIFLFNYSSLNLNQKLKDYMHYKNKDLTLNDISLIYHNHYLKNYNMCRDSIKVIIDKKLVSLDEIELLKLIYNRKYEDELL